MERKEKLSIYNAYDCWHIVPRESKHGALDTILQTYGDVRLNGLKLISMESIEFDASYQEHKFIREKAPSGVQIAIIMQTTSAYDSGRFISRVAYYKINRNEK